MNEPLVTVVVPCYNGASYLADCIRSVVDQQVDCEIIVVDDGSSDRSAEVVREMMATCPRPLMLLQQRNQGPATARNAGLRLARGKYICFLDVDDEYLPGFFRAAIEVMHRRDDNVAIACEIELVGCDRPVADWQRREVELTHPGNVLVLTDIARQACGFPEHPAFRGRSASEDVVFRNRLTTFGHIQMIQKPLYRYRVQPGSHLYYFLARSRLVDGRIEFTEKSAEETDGSLQRARDEHDVAVLQRMTRRMNETLHTAFTSVANYLILSQRFEVVEGFLHHYEGLVLYMLARHWPAGGVVVEIGSFKGKSTCWLATGCKDGQRKTVVAVDHFQGSPEHQPGGTHPDPDIARHGSTLPKFQENLARFGLSDAVTIRVGTSASVAPTWTGPIRLLFIDGDHSFEATQQDFDLWSPNVVLHGLVVFHDLGVWPGVTQFVQHLLQSNNQWRLVGQYYSLGVVERIA